ncbi:MAG: hypothetical protein ABFD82_11440 [Syntrophaceae bacterium]
MKRYLCSALPLLMVFILCGCIQDTIVIHVKPDGSGTIEETSLLSNSIIEIMESFASGMGGSDAEKSGQDKKDAIKGDPPKEAKKTSDDMITKMLKDAELRAATYGASVKFISAKPVTTDTGSGYSAVYAFQDINQVRVNQNPSDKLDSQKAEKNASPAKEEFLLFTFVQGSPSKLVVTFPAQKSAAVEPTATPESVKGNEDKPNKEADAQAMEMIKNIFKDMRLVISLKFEGTIVKTNASYRDGSMVTLVEMDFNKFLDNADLLKQLNAAKPQSIEATKALLKNVKGLKFEMNNPVTVEFQ